MFLFAIDDPLLQPAYMSSQAAAADLKSRVDLTIAPGAVGKVPTGLRITGLKAPLMDSKQIPELQIRARSGLAVKHMVSLANGVGTIDADYRDEICVLLVNHGQEPFHIKRGDRIAQMVCQTVLRLDCFPVGEQRLGGFGSTGVSLS